MHQRSKPDLCPADWARIMIRRFRHCNTGSGRQDAALYGSQDGYRHHRYAAGY